MSLRLIELQVALPRTHDAGKVQNQLSQQSQINQSQAADSMRKESELKKTQVEEQEETYKSEMNDQGSTQSEQHHHEDREEKKKQRDVPHPYKGQQVDYSG